MTFTNNSQDFESYLPVYDAIPEDWDESKDLLTERLKAMANAINIREVGWFLDEQVLTGQQFIPSATVSPQQFRSIFRKVVDFSPLAVGVNSRAHDLTFDDQFTLMHLYAAATDSVAFTAIPIPNPTDSIDIDATNININSVAAYDRCFAVVEYIQEL